MKKFTLLMALVLGFAMNALALNPYAYGITATTNAQDELVVNYSLNAAATAAEVVFYANGEELTAAQVALTGLTKGAHSQAVTTPTNGGHITWAIRVHGTSVADYTSVVADAVSYGLDHPQGVEIDNNPESDFFGRIYTAETMQSPGSWTCSAGQAGLYAFNPDFTLINGVGEPYTGGNTFHANMETGFTAYAPRKIRLSEDGRLFISAQDNQGVFLWEADPADLSATWTNVIAADSLDEFQMGAYRVAEGDTALIAVSNVAMDVKGGGDDLKILMLGGNRSGILSGHQYDWYTFEYALGTAATTNQATLIDSISKRYFVNRTGVNVAYDKKGGFWACQYRGTATALEPGLIHVNAEGAIDFMGVDGFSNLRAGAIRYYNDSVIAIANAAKRVGFYKEGVDRDGKPTLTLLGNVATVGNNSNDIAFDIASNMYVVNNSNEKISRFALPYSGVAETPAKEEYAFDNTPTDLDKASAAEKPVKFFENGTMLIRKGNAVYSVTGVRVR